MENRTAPRLELGAALAGQSRLDLVEHVAMLVLLAIWAVPFTRAQGGRGVHHELLFAAALLLLLPAMRAWRAPVGSLALGSVTAACAELVCVFAPSGWSGSDVAAGYAIAAGCYVACRRYVRDGDRRKLVAVGICVAGLYQFEQAFLPWWGSRDPATEMSGTFYWHNPYAAFLLPAAVLGLGLIASRESPWNLVGWVSTPLCTAGVVFSSSRATMVALVVAFILVLALGIRGWQVLWRFLGGLAVTAATVLVLPGPPFFASYSSPLAATAVRAATGETLTQNGEYRTEFWRGALQVFAHHPVVGSGYHALATASAFYTPTGWARSPLAHDAYLQAMSDGGLLLALPFLTAVAVVLFWALRPLWAIVRRRWEGDVVELSIAVALIACLAHSAVDFDWSHPSILVEVALLAACVAPTAQATTRIRWRVPALATLAAVLIVSIPALHEWQLNQPNLSHSTGGMLADADGTFGDYRPAQALLYADAHGQRALTSEQSALALSLTSREAGVDLHLALLREAVGAQTGLIPGAVAAARRTLENVDGSTEPYQSDLALVLLSGGESREGEETLRADIATQVANGLAAPTLPEELLMWAQRLGTGSGYACELYSVRTIFDVSSMSTLPSPTAACPRSIKVSARASEHKQERSTKGRM